MSGEKKPGEGRLVSLDAYRGFIMLAMASGGLGLMAISKTMDPPSAVWDFLGYQFDHVAWEGCAFWDLIQPSFMFMVGVAMPFSLASRAAKGDTWTRQFFHALWRAFVLVALAVFLSSPERLPAGVTGYKGPLTNWIFPNVLAQIGLGYVFLFLLAGRGWRVQLAAACGIAVGYTLYFGLWPLPPAGFDHRSVQVPPYVEPYTGWFAHWNKNTNAAHHFDLWFLNLFPRAAPFAFNEGGYQTLNFVPSLITMILGLMAGEMLRREKTPAAKFGWLVAAGVVCLAAGWVAGQVAVPIVKRVWTPSWAVYSAGWTFLMLAAFYGVIDVLGWKGWEWPLVVVGMNSIAMYVMSQLMGGWVKGRWRTHLGEGAFAGPYGPLWLSLLTVLTLWVFCYWLYRRKVFLRI